MSDSPTPIQLLAKVIAQMEIDRKKQPKQKMQKNVGDQQTIYVSPAV